MNLRDDWQRPLTTGDLDKALTATARDFPDACTPPGFIFHDPDLYRRDLDEIFARFWLCVGHHSRLAEAGDYFTVDIGDESVLVVLDDDARPRAYLNVCRHRGTRVVRESTGRCRGFLCPYHAWRYALDGRLIAAPGMDAVAGFSREDFSLLEIRIDSLLGFLFINFDDSAGALVDAFGDFPDLDHYRLPDLVRVARHEYDVASNWKLICENYHECYHCGIAHPQLHRISDYGGVDNAGSSGRLFVGGPMAMKPGVDSMVADGHTSRMPFPDLSDDDRRIVHYFNLLPNFLLSIAPDYVLTHHVWPRGPERVFIETEWFCLPEQIGADGFTIDDAEAFWDTTNRQDWKLCEHALAGLKSRHHVPGRYHPSEDCAHRFDQWYVRTMFPQLTGHGSDTVA